MSTIVIMPGGFHPFHAGHADLYQSAVQAFPGAEVFVAATNDTSNRPFPFAIKEKLAKLAGVKPGHFVQVKSPFRAEEITSQFDPDRDRLIFVRSEKDADKPPQAGGVKKDGKPAYLQPLAGQTNIRPFKEHAYMAYFRTVEFLPGMTGASDIRAEWPTLDQQGKINRVMSLYPTTQKNPKLAANVVAMLDTVMGGEQGMAEGWGGTGGTLGFIGGVLLGSTYFPGSPISTGIVTLSTALGAWVGSKFKDIGQDAREKYELESSFLVFVNGKQISANKVNYREAAQQITNMAEKEHDPNTFYTIYDTNSNKIVWRFKITDDEVDESVKQDMSEKLGDDRPKLGSKRDAGKSVRKWRSERGLDEIDAQNFVGGMTASYQRRENQPVAEDYMEEKRS